LVVPPAVEPCAPAQMAAGIMAAVMVSMMRALIPVPSSASFRPRLVRITSRIASSPSLFAFFSLARTLLSLALAFDALAFLAFLLISLVPSSRFGLLALQALSVSPTR
jgi:hypothetical protein